MSDLLDLAERCEEASGEDFWIDRAICELVQPEAAVGFAQPDYTASIDAAMMLVPEGWHWSLYDTNGSAIEPLAVAQLEPEQFSSEPITGEAKTPALALTAAALRARAASVDRSGEADETRSGSAEGESAVPAQQGDAQPSAKVVNND